jgi:hypothetical protein
MSRATPGPHARSTPKENAAAGWSRGLRLRHPPSDQQKIRVAIACSWRRKGYERAPDGENRARVSAVPPVCSNLVELPLRDRETEHGSMAQPGSAPAWHAGGQGFESPWIHPRPPVGQRKASNLGSGLFCFSRTASPTHRPRGAPHPIVTLDARAMAAMGHCSSVDEGRHCPDGLHRGRRCLGPDRRFGSWTTQHDRHRRPSR